MSGTRTAAVPSDHLSGPWAAVGRTAGVVERVSTSGPDVVLPSVFDVTGFASGAVAAAALAVAELGAVRTGEPVAAVAVDRTAACASFLSEALFEPEGWERPAVWDPIAGDYPCVDGWIRLHTNYASHRAAALSVLGVDADREAVATHVATWVGDDLEQAVVDAGGCAAALRTLEQWQAHPAGTATAGEAPVRLGDPIPITGGMGFHPGVPPGAEPLAGIRVLDLTRVIAGPVATRYLAAYGADVLRIDPPGFDEVGALLPETTAGKWCARLDLRADGDRARFEALVADAHVVVGGLRPGALDSLGYGPTGLRTLNPAVVTVSHDAYGWAGPWAGRRGFDSLVQMSTGIAAAGAAAIGADRPVPLPAQALDHGVGHLLAAGTCRALTRLLTTGATGDVRASLVGAASALIAAPTPEGIGAPLPQPGWAPTVAATTVRGPARRVPPAGTIAGHQPAWSVAAGPLGRHTPNW